MNKKLCLIFFLLSAIYTEPFYASHSGSLSYFSQRIKPKQIKLERLSQKGINSSDFIPYKVEVDNQSIGITYLQELSNVVVEIFNDRGECIWSTTSSLKTNEHLSILTGDWGTGAYTIYLRDNEINTVFCGEFEL